MDDLSDRISDLPNSIIDCILSLLPIHEAVATSALSREWRHKWRTIPNLTFNCEFMKSVVLHGTNGDPTKLTPMYNNIVGKVLLQHLGPIQRFSLHLPLFRDMLHLDFISWMHFLSQKDAEQVIIRAQHAQIKLPSYVFHCSKLQVLKIVAGTVDFHHPWDFKEFCNLRFLDLYGLLDGIQISNLIAKCPLLERLSLDHVADGHTLVIDAPRLLSLYINYRMNMFLKLKNVRGVTTISLRFGKWPYRGMMELCDLFDIFRSVPNVVIVTLANLNTVKGMPRDDPTSLPTTLHYHTSLTLLDTDISSLRCVYFILCILKSSPNLKILNLGMREALRHPSATNEDEDALHTLEIQLREPGNLNSLLTVKIKGLLGSKVETMFIKGILSWSPVLETIYLTGNDNIANEAEFTLVSELLKCKRPSSQAQVIYSRPPGDSSIFNF